MRDEVLIGLTVNDALQSTNRPKVIIATVEQRQ